MATSLVVLLIKSTDSDNDALDEYTSFLSTNQIPSVIIAPIDFVYINQTLLNEQILNHPDRYWALVATSPRAGKAVRNVFDENKQNPAIEMWNRKKFYAVGPASVNIMPYPDKTIIPTNDHNVHGLIYECILKGFMENKNENKKLEVFFPCGDLAVDNLPKMLSRVGVPCNPCVIYKTIPKLDFESRFRDKVAPWLSQGVHFFVVFFSPSCFKNSIRVIEYSLEFEKSTFIAIGKQTQTTIISHLPAKKPLVCSQPSPQALLDVISTLGNQL